MFKQSRTDNMSRFETAWIPLTEAVSRFHGAGIQLTYNQLYRRVLDAKIPSTRLGGQIGFMPDQLVLAISTLKA